MKLNSKFTTTAAFLLSALLFAGCAANGAPEESMPPESASPAPFSDSDISSGIQTGADAEAVAALLGDWEIDKAELKAEGEDEYAPAEVENYRAYTFHEDGTGLVQYPEWSDTFDYAIQGELLTLELKTGGTLEMYQASFGEDGSLILVRMNNDGSVQDLRETFVHPVE